MIDTLYQSGTDQVLDDMVRRPAPPKPPPAPGFGFVDLLKAPFQGIGAGASESIAFRAETSGAFGDVLAGTGTASAGGMFSLQSDAEKKDAEAARRRMLAGETPYNNEGGDLFRQRAKDMMPDPQSTHVSAQVVAGVFKFGAKMAGYTAGGNPFGAIDLGMDEALSEADRLKQQGVDQPTRMKAGAVAGTVAGVSAVVPMSGASAWVRGGKGVLVGEGSIIGQAAAEKAILKHAGYDKIADTFDPYDPVALAVGLVPGALGAALGRPHLADTVRTIESGGRKTDRAGNELQGPPTKYGTAKGDMQVLDSTALDPGYGIKPAKVVEGQIDPADRSRVGVELIGKLSEKYGDDEKAMAAYNWGAGNLDKLLAEHPNDWRTRLPAETQDYLAKGRALLDGEKGVAEAVKADPALVDAARVTQTADAIDAMRLTADHDLPGRNAHTDAMELAHDQIARGERVDVSDVMGGRDLDPARAQPMNDRYAYLFGDMEPKYEVPAASQATMRADANGMPEIRTASIRLTDATPTTRMEHVGQPGDNLTRFAVRDADGGVLGHTDLLLRDGKVVSLYDVETTPGLRNKGVGAKVIEAITSLEPDRKIEISNIVDEAVPFWEKVGAQVSDGNRSPTLDWHQFAESPSGRSRGAPRRSESLARDAEAADAAAAGGDGRAALSAGDARELTPEEAAAFFHEPAKTEAGEPGPAAIDHAATEVAALHPDMLVQLDGMESPVRVGDLLEQVRKEAADEARDARLVEIAANCFLRN